MTAERVVLNALRDLFVVPIDGSAPAAPILPAESGRLIDRMLISPDGEHVVYTASTPGGATRAELFSARIDGDRAPLKLSGPPAPGIIWALRVTPDGGRVVYLADQETQGVIEIFSVPIDGSSGPVKLNGPFAPGRGIRTHDWPFLVSPDGAHVVYLADQGTDDVFELYSVPIDGHASAVKLSGSMVPGGDVERYAIDALGARVVYLADQEANGKRELYGVAIDGSEAPVELNGSVTRSGDVWPTFGISPDGARVVYIADEDRDGQRELRAAPTDRSGACYRLSPHFVTSFEFSPDGERVAYLHSAGALSDIYSVPIERGQAINLTQTSGQFEWPHSGFRITPDGDHVVYMHRGSASQELRKVAIEGGSEPVVLGALPGTTSWRSFALSSDGRHAVLNADTSAESMYEVFSAPLDGDSGFARLNDPLDPEQTVGDVLSFRVGAQGGSAAFTVWVPGTDDGDGRVELFRVALERGAEPVRLFPHGPFYGGYVTGCELGAGPRVVFLADSSKSGYNLWSAAMDGDPSPVLLNDPTTSASGVGGFQLAPGGELVVFDAYQAAGSELYGVAIGGGQEIELSGELVEGGEVRSYQVTPDAGRVLYAADQVVGQVVELFSVPLDESAGPVRLNGPLTTGGDVDPRFEIGSDAARVVYLADQETDEVFDLFAAAADGSSSPMKLSGSLVAGGDVVAGFKITSDGQTVVFCADRDSDEVFELYRAPIDGGGPPVKVSGVPNADGDVQDFLIVPGDHQVVYRADQESDDRFELFTVALDGPFDPLKLSGTLVAGGDVQSEYLVAPDGGSLIYRADRAQDEQFELFAIGLDGGAPPIQLNESLPAGGDVLDVLRFSPDSTQVLFVADRRADELFELFAAPIDRAKAARRLNGPLVQGGDVVLRQGWLDLHPEFEPTLDGRGVLYLADQDTDDAFELYFSSLVRAAPGVEPTRREAR